MRPEDYEQFQKIARDLEKMRPSYDQMQEMSRQTESARKLLSDPAIQKSYSDMGRIFEMRNQALAQMPDVATQRAMIEAARYFESTTFLVQKDELLHAAQVARQRLGPEGLAASGRIAARRTADDGSQERAVERIRAGQATVLLEEATQLAVSPEVREAVEQADPDALLRLDEEQRLEAPAAELETAKPSIAEPEVYEDEYPQFTKEELLEMHEVAQLLLWPLQVALVTMALLNPAAPILASLVIAVGGLIAFTTWSKTMISRWED